MKFAFGEFLILIHTKCNVDVICTFAVEKGKMKKREGRHSILKLILISLKIRGLLRGEGQIFPLILLCLDWEWQISFNSPVSYVRQWLPGELSGEGFSGHKQV